MFNFLLAIPGRDSKIPPTTMASSQPPFTVRLALKSDAATIAEIGVHVFTISFGHAIDPQSLATYLKNEYSTEAIENDIDDLSRTLLVSVDQNGQVIGFGYLTRGSDDPCLAHVSQKAELQRIYVNSSAQGKGVGSLLAKSLESLAREQGFTNLWLGVWEENTSAIRAYERWGYQIVGEHDFEIGSDTIHRDLIMLKSL